MRDLPFKTARAELSDLVKRAQYGNEATVITVYGKPAAVILSFEEYQALLDLVRTNGHEGASQ